MVTAPANHASANSGSGRGEPRHPSLKPAPAPGMRPAWHRAGGAFSYASSIRPRTLYAFTETHTERLRSSDQKQPLTAINQFGSCTSHRQVWISGTKTPHLRTSVARSLPRKKNLRLLLTAYETVVSSQNGDGVELYLLLSGSQRRGGMLVGRRRRRRNFTAGQRAPSAAPVPGGMLSLHQWLRRIALYLAASGRSPCGRLALRQAAIPRLRARSLLSSVAQSPEKSR
jgi:hypothetical protein